MESVPRSIISTVASDPSSKTLFYRAGELAKLCGVSKDTLRYYERQGLLPAPDRSAGGYRRYPADSLKRVRLIRSALAIGFSVDELARIFESRRRGEAPCRHVRELTAARLEEIERTLVDLSEARDALRLLLKEWDKRLNGLGSNECAGLLESLAQADSGQGTVTVPRVPRIRRENTGKRSNK